MRRTPTGFWSLWPVAVLLLLSALLLLLSPNGIVHLHSLYQDYWELLSTNEALTADNRELYEQIDRLRNDPGAIERIARQELGLVRKDELIIYLTPSAAPPSSGRGATASPP